DLDNRMPALSLVPDQPLVLAEALADEAVHEQVRRVLLGVFALAPQPAVIARLLPDVDALEACEQGPQDVLGCPYGREHLAEQGRVDLERLLGEDAVVLHHVSAQQDVALPN